MGRLSLSYKQELKNDLPERILQFGEGNFLRGFVDWLIHQLNKNGLFNGRIVAVQPTPRGRVVGKLNEQDGLYTMILQGLKDGKIVDEREVITSVSRGINPYEAWEDCLKCAENAAIEFIFSNTTEAGLTYRAEDTADMCPPLSYPGKLTAYLYHRYQFFHGEAAKGMTIIPCELLENNGVILRDLVLRYCQAWNLPEEFAVWIKEHNLFLNTLVDRVVSGYPQDAAEKFTAELGYEDKLMVCGELFHFLAIEGDKALADKLPFGKIGLNVVIEPDISAYRTRKVRILNGGHTASVPAAFLAGLDTVGEMMADEVAGKFVRQVIYKEILPSLALDKAMLKDFADAVINRFENPFIRHQLLSILLNSSAKFKARVVPSILDYQKTYQTLPPGLLLSFAAYIYLYKNAAGAVAGTIKLLRDNGESEMTDDLEAVRLMQAAWRLYDGSAEGGYRVAKAVLQSRELWDEDLSQIAELAEGVGALLVALKTKGARAVMKELVGA